MMDESINSRIYFWSVKRFETVKSVITCTASIIYSERQGPRVIMLCSESLEGLESTVTSILRREQLLSKEGFSSCGTKYQNEKSFF